MSGKVDRPMHPVFLATILLAFGISGCSLVKKQDLDAQLAGMKAEMEADRAAEIAEGDRRVSEELGGRIDALSARVDGLEQDLASLVEDFDARVEELEDALRFDAPVYFGFDDDELSIQHMTYLDRFAGIVGEYYPTSLITVEGFTDPVGTADYNLALGRRRAQAVKDYLVQQRGFGEGRIRVVSYGEAADRLVAADRHGPGNEGWENRRVVLVIDHSGD